MTTPPTSQNDKRIDFSSLTLLEMTIGANDKRHSEIPIYRDEES